jgi:tRNA threonylcarbamoyl adenosine modification protein (Sua5/YciO/YrdC/YwlC family)
MIKIKIDPRNITKKKLDLIVEYFKLGKVVIYPTDTIYGIGCLADNCKAIERIYKIKKRKRDKPLLILVSSISMLNKYCYISEKQRNYLETVWPGPVSVILKSKGKLPSILSAKLRTLAARLPKNELLVTMIKNLGVPIVSTSLNLSNQPILGVNNLERYFPSLCPDLIVYDGDAKRVKPSKLLDIRDINNIKILRK